MNTQISTKLAALGVALIMNSALVGSVAFLFNGQVRPALSAVTPSVSGASSLTERA